MTQMRAFPNLTPWERVALAHRIRSFMRPPVPEDSAEDYATLVDLYKLDEVQQPKQTIPIERAMEILSGQAGSADARSGRTTVPAAAARDGG